MRPENTIGIASEQHYITAETGFFGTPIANKGEMLLAVSAGLDTQDALQAAKVLSSGLSQICEHLHDSLNMGEMAYCDGVRTLGFIAETVSALVWSVQRGMAPKTDGGGQ